MLQFRIFAYADAHRYRLGVNHESLPVNRPHCPVHDYHRVGDNDYSQVGALFRLMSREQQQQLFGNIAAAMCGVPETIQLRQIDHFAKADPAYGRGVAERLGLTSRLAAAE